MATCAELSNYRLTLSGLAGISGSEFPAVVQARAELDAWVTSARNAGFPESFIITAGIQPRNAWEDAAVNLFDVLIPSELQRVQSAFSPSGVCASGASNIESGLDVLPASAFAVPAPPPLPSLNVTPPPAGTTAAPVSVPVAPVQGGTVQSDAASTAPLLGQVTTISPATRQTLTGPAGTIDGIDGPVTITSETAGGAGGGAVGAPIAGGIGGAALTAAAGGSTGMIVLVGLGLLALVVLLSRKDS